MKLNKKLFFNHCINLINEKTQNLDTDLIQLKKSSESDSKSAMGDKYETSTELINQERNKLESVKSEWSSHLITINKIDLNPKNQVTFGSLVKTSINYLFISVPLGLVNFDELKIACVSIKSPIAQELLNKKVGDFISLNGKKIKILEIN